MKNRSMNRNDQNFNRQGQGYGRGSSQDWQSQQYQNDQARYAGAYDRGDRSFNQYDEHPEWRNAQYGSSNYRGRESWEQRGAGYRNPSQRFDNESPYGAQSEGTFGSQGGYDNRPQGCGYGVTQRGLGLEGQHGYGRPQYGYGQTQNTGYRQDRMNTGWNQDEYQGRSNQYGSQNNFRDQSALRSYAGSDNAGLYNTDGSFGRDVNMPSQYVRGEDYYTDDLTGPRFRQSTSSNYGSSYGQRSGYGAEQSSQKFRAPKGYSRTDERVREDVCDCLGRMRTVDPSDIEVTVKDGEVTLSGTVDSRSSKYDVETAVDAVSGVKDINNQLRVASQTRATSDSDSTLGTSSGNRSQTSTSSKSSTMTSKHS